MKIISVCICILAIACLLSGCIDETPDETPDAAPNEMMTADTIADIETWDKIISQSGKPVIVEMYADWCGDCQDVEQSYGDMPAKYPNVIFIKIDMNDENNTDLRSEIVLRYGIGQGVAGQTIPDFKVFVSGEYVYTCFINTPEELEQFVKDVADGKTPNVKNGKVPDIKN